MWTFCKNELQFVICVCVRVNKNRTNGVEMFSIERSERRPSELRNDFSARERRLTVLRDVISCSELCR